MEIMAALEPLKHFTERAEFVIYSDSQYTIKGSQSWRKGWKRNGWITQLGIAVKNADLWKEMDEHLNRHKVTFVKVKAHSGIARNEEVDLLAKAAAKTPTEHDHNYIAQPIIR
jgi:ribonuclease HI